MAALLIICNSVAPETGMHLAGIPLEFFFFALTLIGIATFHHHTLKVALTGLAIILAYKLAFQHFSPADHFLGTAESEGEWRILLNLFGLLTGFALLADHFERSHIPGKIPRFLPSDWRGGMVLLAIIFVLSTFLDNIAAAMIGGTVANAVFKGKLHMGYLASIVAASNAGGSGSVLGDTTTTMMWIDGISAGMVLHAFIAAAVAFMIFGILSARQQQRLSAVARDVQATTPVDWPRVGVVAMILAGAIATNVLMDFPALGVWLAIGTGLLVRNAAWSVLPSAIRGSVFLLALVTCASMMPVEELPAASWQTTFVLGFVSSVFDNIPLTKLALDQMAYDWGLLAYAVGFGGSMVWFGSSAGVALSNMYPQVKSVTAWVKNAWYIALAYIIGFFVLLFICGWHPVPPHK